MIAKKQLLSRFDGFVKSLSKNDNIAVMYHADGDGLSACLIIDKAIFSLLGKRIFAFPRKNPSNAIDVELISVLKQKQVSKAIFTDINIDKQQDLAEEITNFAEILVIDHHKGFVKIVSDKITSINADELESKIPSESFPAAKMCYDLFSRHANLEKDVWIVLLGLKADVGEKQWKSFISKHRKKFSDKLVQFLLDSLNAIAVLAPDEFPEVYEQLFETKNPKSLQKSGLGKYVKEFYKLRELWVKKIKQEAEVFPEIELVFYVMKHEKRGLKSIIVDEAKKAFPHNTFLLLQEKPNGFTTISGRREDKKIKVNELLGLAVRSLDHSAAGGHEPAAGGIIQSKDLKKFKKNIKRILQDKYGEKKAKQKKK